MDITAEHAIDIAAPPERVWAVTQDWSRRASWDPGIEAVRAVDPSGRRVEARGFRGTDIVVTVTALDPPRSCSAEIAPQARVPVDGGSYTWTYAPRPDGGTRLTVRNTIRVSGLTGRVIAPAIRRELDSLGPRALEAVRRLAEAPT